MHYLTTLLFLTAAASAIDIREFPDESHCAGDYFLYRDAKPNICYTSGEESKSSSFGFYAIPKNWRISTRSHTGWMCKVIKWVRDSNGRDTVCHGAKKPLHNYEGAGYSFINKRGEPVAGAAGSRECRGPDVLVYEHGPTYDLKGLDEATVKMMREIPNYWI
ncbi:hypothetical protein G6514_000503 [Epicoccum nigrum]|nr:hypothetical protein G6514_000503 [Epicoccum nigrum]